MKTLAEFKSNMVDLFEKHERLRTNLKTISLNLIEDHGDVKIIEDTSIKKRYLFYQGYIDHKFSSNSGYAWSPANAYVSRCFSDPDSPPMFTWRPATVVALKDDDTIKSIGFWQCHRCRHGHCESLLLPFETPYCKKCQNNLVAIILGYDSSRPRLDWSEEEIWYYVLMSKSNGV